MSQTLKARIAETLAQHAYASVEMGKGIDGGFFFVCECGHREVKTAAGKRDWLADHQAQEIAPLLTEAQAEAWDKAVVAIKGTIGAYTEEGVWATERAEKHHPNPYRATS